MLQIFLNSPTESGFLQIPPNVRLDMESLAKPFDGDLSKGEYSLPGTLSWLPQNLRITGFTDRITNFNKALITFKVVYDAGFPNKQGGNSLF